MRALPMPIISNSPSESRLGKTFTLMPMLCRMGFIKGYSTKTLPLSKMASFLATAVRLMGTRPGP